MIFMAKVCPKAINFATAESIHQLLALRPHPSAHLSTGRQVGIISSFKVACSTPGVPKHLILGSELGKWSDFLNLHWFCHF